MDNDTQQDLEEKRYVSLARNHGYQVTDVQGREQRETPETVNEWLPSKGTIATMTGIPRFHTLQIRGTVQGHRVGVLIDGGASHNFIDAAWVKKRHSYSEF